MATNPANFRVLKPITAHGARLKPGTPGFVLLRPMLDLRRCGEGLGLLLLFGQLIEFVKLGLEELFVGSAVL